MKKNANKHKDNLVFLLVTAVVLGFVIYGITTSTRAFWLYSVIALYLIYLINRIRAEFREGRLEGQSKH